MNVLDLFSGIGGFSLGLERAGMKTVAFCEIDPEAQKVLNKHWPSVPIFSDVSKLTAKDIHEPIDIICGGFPCQDLSTAGRGEGLAGARSGLWYEFHRLIEEIRPKYAIIENVSVLRSRGLDQVLRSLSEIGYDAEWHCIPAAALGAPHRRDRVWIVAYPHCLGRPREGLLRPITSTPGGEGKINQLSDGGSDALAVATLFSRFRSYWTAQPSVGRVAHGVPRRMDRLTQLGNAVVPQIPELIGRAILATEHVNRQ